MFDERRSTLGDWLSFRNGRKSPERTTDAKFSVFGSNGIIGFADVTNVDSASVVIGRVGSYCGSTYFAPDPCWVTDNAIVAVAAHTDETRFWYYALRSLRLNDRRHGSGQPLLNQEILNSIEFKAPLRPARLGIATTLGALDDKIESNRRAGSVIDELARSIYAQWLSRIVAVDQSTFGHFADVFGGATPRTSEPSYWDGGLAWATPTDVTHLEAPHLLSTSRTITHAGLASCAAVLHPAGTIFMTSRATIGAFAVNQLPAATNQGFIAVRPKRRLDRWFLFEEMRSRVLDFLDHANGSTFLEISRGSFKALPLATPADADLVELDEQLDPLHQKAAQLAAESCRLAALRDELLPELLSGRIRVPEAAEAVREVTA